MHTVVCAVLEICQQRGHRAVQMVGQKQSLLAALPADDPLVAGRAPSPGPPGLPGAVRNAMAAQAALDREVCTPLLLSADYSLVDTLSKLVCHYQLPPSAIELNWAPCVIHVRSDHSLITLEHRSCTCT